MQSMLEGSEQRFECHFVPNGGGGLRSVPRPVWDVILDDANSSIHSVKPGDNFDAYLMSESNLFIYDYKIVVKSGAISVLNMLPRLLFEAAKLDLHVDWVQYSRSNFSDRLKGNSEIHQKFDGEVTYLKEYFPEGKSFLIGPLNAGYHVFIADYTTADPQELTQQTMEIRMSNCDSAKMSEFFSEANPSGEEARKNSGLDACFMEAELDDKLDEPSGYSLNGLRRDGYYAVHVQPSADFSYVSFETQVPMQNYSELLTQVVSLFRPGNVCAVVFCDAGAASANSTFDLHVDGYSRLESSRMELVDKSIFYYCNYQHASAAAPKAKPKAALGVDASRRGPSVDEAMEGVKAHFPVEVLTMSIAEYAARKAVELGDQDNSFFISDLNRVADKYLEWITYLPRAEPHYAVKCNPDSAVIKLLHGLGSGFDCASAAEMDKCIALGVDPKNIIYANPCKLPKHIKHAKSVNVQMMTFDNVAELEKIAEFYPTAKVVLRLHVNDEKSICRMSTKYGARKQDVPALLATARDNNLNLIGCSFHVGSGCTQNDIFEGPLRLAHWVMFTEGPKYGFDNMNFLDLGGGFPGDDNPDIKFSQLAKNIRPLLDELFPPSVRVIAEPGRFFAHGSMNLVVKVFGKRVEGDDRFLYVNDGVYGSFNCMMYDHVDVFNPTPLPRSGEVPAGARTFKTTVFGPTCDGLDRIMHDVQLPELDIDDCILFTQMGAYTIAAATNFNGFNIPLVYYVHRPMVNNTAP